MPDLLPGQFLVATPQLQDTNFYRTVILLLEYNSEGAMGLVINRPSAITLDSAFAQAEDTSLSNSPIFSGGPVETTALFILHDCPNVGGSDEHVASGIYLTGSNDTFSSLVGPESPCDHSCGFRVYCGYAGWGEGQLDDEIDRGDWRVMPATPRLVFHVDPYEAWDKATAEIQKQSRLLPHNVVNPEWN